MTAPDVLRELSDSTYLHTEFLERVAHELRGPVGVTSGALDEIELALGADAEDVREYFLMARRGMQRVVRMAERLHRTAQLEAGPIAWAKTRTDLQGLVQEAVNQTMLVEARRGVSVNLSRCDDACWVLVDPDWMRMAIVEVVANAIRFARSCVTVHTEVAPAEVKVVILDDGPGFSGPVARRFEPPSDKRGIGLSLPLVSDVVAAHGGRIEVDRSRTCSDDSASGARVVLVLPLLAAGET